MNNKAKLLKVYVYIDGGARGNPGQAGAGVVIHDADDNAVIFKGGYFLGETTNNVAEYQALLKALQLADKFGAQMVEIKSDSELLVRQMNGEYRVRNANLKTLFDQARDLMKRFKKCTFSHIPREENKTADKLVNQAINLKSNVEDAEGSEEYV